jgi:iron complex outermembrane receptor protein
MHPCRARIVFPALMWATTVWADEAPLVDLALEDLARLEVATVSRKAQKLSETSAAVTVLTAEDIRRSGARSVPEALREVPGVSVTQIGAGRWAVGVRGYAGRFSNKLLVLIDGRSVYSPLFSGVFWEALDVMLEDVERIEVVRGPGASLWGANAVNGVINIVTRKATASRGGLLSMRLDNQGHPAVAVRQGVELGGAGALRVFAKGNELAESRSASGESGVDGNRGWLAGFRMDSAGSGTNAWMVQGNTYRRSSRENLQTSAQAGLPLLLPLGADLEGSSLVGRYTWGLAGGEASLQGYVDTQRIEAKNYGTGEVRTADLDFQHRLAPMGGHELMWGLGSRFVQTEIHLSTPVLVVSPSGRKFNVASAFVQDEITLQPRVWKLTLGGRFEHSTISRLEPQPNARLMWTPTDADSVWANWSRAARTPSVGEIDTQMFAGLQQTGNPRMPVVAMVSRPGPNWAPRAERLDALELGYRRGFGNGSFEAVLFHHDYTHLTSTSLDPGGVVLPGVAGLVPAGVVPLQYLNRGNVGSARSTGLELGLDLPVTENLRLQASYTLMDIRAGRSSDPVTQASGEALEEASPHYWANLHGLLNLGRGRELDLMVRRMGAIGLGHVPAYTSVDLRYGWRVSRSFELAVVGVNLFDPLHQEYAPDFVPSQPAYQPRQGFVQGMWRF